jgi:hypothetical protein
MGILRTNTLSGIGTDGPVFDGITRLDTFGYVVPPVGVTSDRTLAGVTTAQGAIRFNTDSQKLEFYAQDQWWEMVIDTPALGTSSDTGAGARGLFGGGFTGPSPANAETDVIQYINISSAGNAVDFGDLSATRRFLTSLSSSTRGVFGGGVTSTPALTYLNVIEYITISSTGNAVDFGDLSVGKAYLSACSSSTRGVFGGGYTPTPAVTILNTIEYITISSTGNAQDFGDLSVGRLDLSACSSSTRGVFGGGVTTTPAVTIFNTIEYITISSTGNAQDFGDLSVGKYGLNACSSSTRGIFAGGFIFTPAFTYFNTIEFITISSTGNAVDFGDLSVGKNYSSSCSSPTRGVFGGGGTPTPATTGFTNTIEYINISSFGDAVDFGDLSAPTRVLSACSNAHGGL